MKINLNLSFYSPVHIGSGEELEPFDYIIRDHQLCTFSFERWLESLSQEERTEFLKLQKVQNKEVLRNIRQFIRDHSQNVQLQQCVPVTSTVAQQYREKFDDIENMLIINPFIKTMNTPYIPGSSLKGALRTAILNYWANKDNINYSDECEILNACRNVNFKNKIIKRLIIPKDVFRFLKVRDIHLTKESTFFASILIHNIEGKQTKETKIQQLREITKSFYYSVPPFEEAKNQIPFEIEIDRERIEENKESLGRHDLTFETLWNSLDFYETLLDKEAEKRTILGDFYCEFKNFIREQRKRRDIKLLKIGFGSGFEAVTVEQIRDENKKYGKSFKSIESCCPLGWVVLSRN